MKKSKQILIVYFVLLISSLFSSQISADTVLQSFKGSIEKGEYKADFVEFDYAKSAEKTGDKNH